jgi:hypothetical protein
LSLLQQTSAAKSNHRTIHSITTLAQRSLFHGTKGTLAIMGKNLLYTGIGALLNLVV